MTADTLNTPMVDQPELSPALLNAIIAQEPDRYRFFGDPEEKKYVHKWFIARVNDDESPSLSVVYCLYANAVFTRDLSSEAILKDGQRCLHFINSKHWAKSMYLREDKIPIWHDDKSLLTPNQYWARLSTDGVSRRSFLSECDDLANFLLTFAGVAVVGFCITAYSGLQQREADKAYLTEFYFLVAATVAIFFRLFVNRFTQDSWGVVRGTSKERLAWANKEIMSQKAEKERVEQQRAILEKQQAMLKEQFEKQQASLNKENEGLKEELRKHQDGNAEMAASNHHMRQLLLAKTAANPNDLNNPCCICLEKEAQIYNLPCGHCNLCLDCCHSLPEKKCPVCRANVGLFLRAYL